MKKVSDHSMYSTVDAITSPSSHVLRRSDLRRNASNMLQGLVIIVLSNSSLLMSPLSIAEQHTEGTHGPFVERKLSERLFLRVDDGMTRFLNMKHYCAYLVSLF